MKENHIQISLDIDNIEFNLCMNTQGVESTDLLTLAQQNCHHQKFMHTCFYYSSTILWICHEDNKGMTKKGTFLGHFHKFLVF